MKFLLLCLIPLLLYLTACQTNRPLRVKDPLLEEQAVLDYFVDSIIPNDEHFSEGYNFEFDFVLRNSFGDSEEQIDPARYKPRYFVHHTSDSIYSIYNKLFNSPFDRGLYPNKEDYPIKIPFQKEWNFKKVKYETKYFDNFYYISNGFCVVYKYDTSDVNFFKKNTVRLFLGTEGTYHLPSKNSYKEFRFQAVYKHNNIIYDKSYYFTLKNNEVRYVGLSLKNHKREHIYKTKNISIKPPIFN